MKSEWQACTIGELCDSVSVTYRGEDERVVLVNTSDVLNGKVLNHTDEPNQNLKGQFKKTFKRNDILYSEIRPANRRFAYIDFDETEKYIASTKLMVIRYRENVVEPKFLYFLLTSNVVIGELQRLAETRSGTFPQITFPAEVATLPVNIPPLPIQRKIASILSSLDDKIETNNAICRNLEEQIKLIFKDTYASKVKASSARIEDVTLADVCSAITKGTTPSTLGHRFENVGVNFVKAESITNCHRIEKNKISFISLETHNKLKRSQVEDGDILFSIAGTLGRFTLAATHILPANTNQAVAIIRANKEKVAPEYLYSLFIAGWHEEYCKKNVQQAVQANLSLGIIKSLPIFLLLGQEMKNYLSKITPLITTMKKLERESSSLAYLRDALLPKLMSGELEVETLV